MLDGEAYVSEAALVETLGLPSFTLVDQVLGANAIHPGSGEIARKLLAGQSSSV